MPADSAPAWPVMSIAQANALLAAEGSPVAVTDGNINGVDMISLASGSLSCVSMAFSTF